MGLFSKSEVKANMGWRYVRYTEKDKSILLTIEPLVGRPDIVYIPDKSSWTQTSPVWAKNRYHEIITYLKSIPWNRNLVWVETAGITVIEKSAYEEYALPGSLEATPGGREFEKENLFQPGSPVKPEEAYQLWCRLEKRFAEQASGKVRLFAENIIPDSVFAVISLPTLKENTNVTLEYISSK
ncbi:MAG: hypothetical protein ACYDG2_10745 [Ruminiclostridium sp.]